MKPHLYRRAQQCSHPEKGDTGEFLAEAVALASTRNLWVTITGDPPNKAREKGDSSKRSSAPLEAKEQQSHLPE